MTMKASTAVLLCAALLATTGCTDRGDKVDPAAVSQDESDRVDPWWLSSVPDPDDRTLQLLVAEQDCASGQPATGLIASDVRYEEDAVTVWVNVRKRTEDRSCPGNPDTPYEIKLKEPLGDRKVLDGNQTPDAPARTARPAT